MDLGFSFKPLVSMCFEGKVRWETCSSTQEAPGRAGDHSDYAVFLVERVNFGKGEKV